MSQTFCPCCDFLMSVFSIASMFLALHHLSSFITLSSDINECETIAEACQGEMKCFNHYGGYLCLPRSASVFTASEPSGQSESGLPEVSRGPCPVGYEAQGESCIGKIYFEEWRSFFLYVGNALKYVVTTQIKHQQL